MPFQRLPVGRQAHSNTEVRPGIEPDLPPYQSGVLPKHLQTVYQMIPDGLEPSLPGCRPGVFAAGPRDRVALKVDSPGIATAPSNLERADLQDRRLPVGP